MSVNHPRVLTINAPTGDEMTLDESAFAVNDHEL